MWLRVKITQLKPNTLTQMAFEKQGPVLAPSLTNVPLEPYTCSSHVTHSHLLQDT